MSQIYWIDGRLWLSWTPEQRGEYLAYLDGKGVKWGIDFKSSNPALELQKDKDEYREEISLGGRPFDE